MKKSYLFIYSNKFGSRDDVRDLISNTYEIITWRYDIPNSFYLVSESSADDLSEKFLKYSNEEGLFLIVEIKDNYQGWLPERSWSLINDKKLPPKEK